MSKSSIILFLSLFLISCATSRDPASSSEPTKAQLERAEELQLQMGSRH